MMKPRQVGTTLRLFLSLSLINQSFCWFTQQSQSPWSFNFQQPKTKEPQPWFEQIKTLKCKPGEKLVSKPEGPICMKDYGDLWQQRQEEQEQTWNQDWNQQRPVEQNQNAFSFGHPTAISPNLRNTYDVGKVDDYQEYNEVDAESPFLVDNDQIKKKGRQSFSLPQVEAMSLDDEVCLDKHEILWPQDRQCYKLLSRGPCVQENEWLVLKEKKNSPNEIQITCQTRPCPCNPNEPYLCEVFYEKDQNNCANKCRVALAAEQDGICGQNEQLLVDPYGHGICGCRKNHLRWSEDRKCHPLFAQGPCPRNHTLQFSPPMQEALCVPKICRYEHEVLHSDGSCYELGTQGPCLDGEEFDIDSRTWGFHNDISDDSKRILDYDPKCIPKQKVKRVFDMAPTNNLMTAANRDKLIGSLMFQMTARNCPDGGGILCDTRDKRRRPKPVKKLQTIFELNKKEKQLPERYERAVQYLQFLREFRERNNFL